MSMSSAAFGGFSVNLVPRIIIAPFQLSSPNVSYLLTVSEDLRRFPVHCSIASVTASAFLFIDLIKQVPKHIYFLFVEITYQLGRRPFSSMLSTASTSSGVGSGAVRGQIATLYLHTKILVRFWVLLWISFAFCVPLT